jgi:hypothetical protein
MTLARTSPSEAELWRRLVFWSRASDGMIGGCAGGCTLAVAGSALLLALGARAAHLLAAAAALGVALEGVRRACDLARRRALDAAAPRLLSTRGLSRGAVEQAAAALGSGRIEELDASLAFERLASVLSILGAPAELVDRTRAAGDDEGRHARDAFSLAAAYGGEPLGPGPLRVPDAPSPSIDALAVETFFDGCVGETLGAREASAALTHCRVPAARDAIERVAIDERRHAELAWDMLAWLLPRTSVQARATIAAARSPSSAANGASERERRDDAWLAEHGWLTRAEEDAVEVVAWRDEIGPRRDALLAEPRAPEADTGLVEHS